MPVHPIASVAELLAVISLGHRRRDAPEGTRGSVDTLTHALQTAHEAYLVRPADEELQVAGLVHDLGFLISPPGAVTPRDAPLRGAASIIDLLGPRVARIVALQAEAFRYLATQDTEFSNSLHPDALDQLRIIGGPMTAAEVSRFERTTGFADAIVLAAVDDLAREPTRTVPSLISWKPVLETVAAAARAERDRRLSLSGRRPV